MNQHKIPGFSRYILITPDIEIININRNRGLTIPENINRQITLVDDNGNRVKSRVINFIALAFHGLCPAGHVAVHTGGTYTAQTIKYIPMSDHFKKVNRQKVIRLLLNTDLTYTQISEKIGCSYPTIQRIARKALKY